jgi:DNA-binding NarL/FixJ family response regulator
MPSQTTPARRVRVLLADDHPLYAYALEVLLAVDDRIEVVGVAEHGAQAVDLANALHPDAVLMDVHMPRLDGIAATRRILGGLPHIRVVMLSSSTAAEDVEAARDAGACDYLTKDADANAIVDAVVRAAAAPLAFAARAA